MAPADFFRTLPAKLPEGQPYYYLSSLQQGTCEKYNSLVVYAPHLPGWVPLRRVADALGYSHFGIENALAWNGGTPWVWATEFENVHSFWDYNEPPITVGGVTYSCSEVYYQQQKPHPFNETEWLRQRDGVMAVAVSHKLRSADKSLRRLLSATNPHPLLSLKWDGYWGVDPNGEGSNKLADIWMELRRDPDQYI